MLTKIEAEVEKETRAPLPLLSSKQPGLKRSQPLLRPQDLLGPSYRIITLMLWAAWFAEYGVLCTYQTFVPTILSAEGYSL